MTDRPLYFNRDGEPIDLWAWSRLCADLDYKRVAADQVGPYWISTVWLGIDHGFMTWRGGSPIIFETMVFLTGVDTPLGPDLDMRRYATEAEARQGHDDMVTLIRATYVDVDDQQDETARRQEES